MAHTLVRVADGVDWRAYHDIRRSVLWEERGLRGYDETRPEERLPHHHPLLLKFDGQGAGTTRLDDLRDSRGIVRLVAITANLRRQGHGRIFSMMTEDYARKLGIAALFVSAALDAEGFYASTGWVRCTAGAPEQIGHADHCVQMTKVIAH